MTFLIIDEFHTPHWSLAPFTLVSKGGGAGASPGEAFSPTSRAGVGQWPFNGQWHMATTTVPFRIQPLNYSGYSWGTNGGCFFFFLFPLFFFVSFVKRGNWPLAMGLLYLNMTSAIRPSTECSSVLQSVLHRSSRGKNPRHGIFLSGRRSTRLSYRRCGGFICLARSNG